MFLLYIEHIVKTSHRNDMRPAPSESLRPYFPSFIAKAAIPDDYNPAIEEDIGKIFLQRGMSSIQIYNDVHMAIDRLMCVHSGIKETYREDPQPFYRFLITTSVP